MNCPKCHSENTRIDFVQTSGRSHHSGVGLGGHMNNAARALTAVSTLGMSNLVWKKSKGGSKTKFKSGRMGICQDCGHGWKVH
nr:MAG TPA: RNA polymerase-like protein [Caudoviricetes sp.]